MDLREYTGIGVFGSAYRIMLENEPHAPGSVDRVLLEMSIRGWPGGLRWLHGEDEASR